MNERPAPTDGDHEVFVEIVTTYRFRRPGPDPETARTAAADDPEFQAVLLERVSGLPNAPLEVDVRVVTDPTEHESLAAVHSITPADDTSTHLRPTEQHR